jgi:uncharacterized membrane protein
MNVLVAHPTTITVVMGAAALCLLIVGAYLHWARKEPDSRVRAPMMWAATFGVIGAIVVAGKLVETFGYH